MSKSVVSKQKSNIKKGESRPVQSFKEPFVPAVRKELNGWGKMMILGVWGIMAFIAGINLSGSFSEKKLSALENQLDSLREMDRNRSYNMEQQFDASVTMVENRLDEKYRYKFNKLLEEQQKLSREKNRLMEKLEKSVAQKSFSHPPTISKPRRSPASLVPVLPKVLPYNYANADILRYEHKQKLRRLQEWQSQKERNYLKSVNLSDPMAREGYKAMQEEHEMEYYTLKRTLQEERKRFRKDKFYVRN